MTFYTRYVLLTLYINCDFSCFLFNLRERNSTVLVRQNYPLTDFFLINANCMTIIVKLMPKMPEFLKVISVKLALVALTALYVTCYTKKIYNQMFLKSSPFKQTTPSSLQIAAIQTGIE